jgi:hypothetical protein
MLTRAAGFWFVAVMLVLVLCAASAPSPLYGVYQRLFGFPASTLTAIYGVFAIAGLTTLLTSGRLSDHIGRRPVLLGALGAEIAGMLAFIAASDVSMLFVGRILTGLGTGAGLGALSAWLLDLQPQGSSLGSLVNGVATLLGLAAGALLRVQLKAPHQLDAGQVVAVAVVDRVENLGEFLSAGELAGQQVREEVLRRLRHGHGMPPAGGGGTAILRRGERCRRQREQDSCNKGRDEGATHGSPPIWALPAA